MTVEFMFSMNEQQNHALTTHLIHAHSWEDSESLFHFKLEQAPPPKPGLLTFNF